jgi:hypothetical protein
MTKILRAPKLAALLGALTVAGVGAAVAFATIPDAIDPTGPTGPAAGSLGLVTVWAETSFDSTTPKMKAVDGPTGKKLTRGGARIVLGPGAEGQVEITDSSPTEVFSGGVNVVSETQWFARGDSFPSTADWRVRVYAICADTTSGATGPQGPTGPAGANGLRGLEIVATHSLSNSDTPKQLIAECPPGKKLVGGGGKIILQPGAAGLVYLTWNGPADEDNGVQIPPSETIWVVRADANPVNIAKWQIQAFAVCAFPDLEPTNVAIASFTARTSSRRGVTLRWRAASEFGALGYNVWRFARGKGVKVNRTLIAAKPAERAGGAYRLLDRSVTRGVAYTYRLQVVKTNGTRAWAATAAVRAR